MRVAKEEQDEKGQQHKRFQLYFKNMLVEDVEFALHSDTKGILKVGHGRIPENLDADVSKPMSEQRALEFALADKKRTIADFKGKELPKGELMLTNTNVQNEAINTNYRLVYRFNVYGKGMLDGHKIYVDALTGEIIKRISLIHNCIKNAETNPEPAEPLVASTFQPRYPRFGTTQNFDTEINAANTSFLFWNATGPRSLETQEDTNGDGVWDNAELTNPSVTWGTNRQNATTTHWIVQRTYEYFRDFHGRNGWNGNGLIGRALVNWNSINAQWLETENMIRIGFGPVGGITGNPRDPNRPLTTIDVVAHEWMHGMTNFTGGLVYRGESGALNESISDIFGAVMERRILGNNADWTIGEDAWLLRSMVNPLQLGHPDRYQGQNWADPNNIFDGDAGGVHTNSGVMNKWFHTLCTGQNPYSTWPQAIDFDNATRIVFRALRFYMHNTANYADAREATLVAAQDLFGGCSNEAQQVINAWAAANVGVRYDLDCYNTGAITPGCYRLKAKHSNKYVQIPNAPNNNTINTQIIQNGASGGNNQVFKFETLTYLGGACQGCLKITNQENFKFLKYNGSVPQAGAQVLQDFWRNDQADRYAWKVSAVPDGTFQVAPASNNNYRFDVTGVNTNDGAGIQIHPNNNGDNQKFFFESATCPTSQPACSFVVSASASNTNPSCQNSITLSATCSGDCNDMTYTWSGNGLASNSQSVTVNFSQSGTFNYTLNAYKNNTVCPGQTIVIPVTVYGPCGGTASCTNTGSINYQRWEVIGPGTSIQDLRNNTNNLQNNPAFTQILTSFEAPSDILDSYGVRIRGYVCPPTSGNYTFWVAGDDNVELYISPNDQPNNLNRIAYHNNWTGSQQWNVFPTQQSAPINLQAGQRYYVEALMKEGNGGDNLAVGWQLPNGALERPIPGNRLIPFSAGGGGGPTCNFSTSATVNNANVGCGGGITLNAPCSGPDCSGISYVWSGNGLYQTNQSANTNAPNSNGSYTYYVQASKTGCTTQNNSVVVNVSGCGGGGGSSTCSAENDQCSGNSSEVRNYSVSASAGGSYTIKAFYRSHEGPGVIRWSVNGGAVQTTNVAQTAVNNYPEITLGTANLNGGNNTFSLSSGGGFVCFRKVCIEGVGGGGCTPPAAPTVSANPSNISAGQSSTLSASGCGGTVTWSDGQTGNSISVSPAQTSNYTATCSAGGCTSGNSNTATVTVGGGGGGCASGNFNGHLDYANCGAFGGWVIDFNNYGRTVEVEILVDGAVVATILANQSRPDLVGAFGTPQAEFHGYTYNVPANAPWRNGTKSIVARPCGSSNPLSNSPRTVNFGACRVGVAENLEESSEIVVYPNPSNGELTLQMFLENRSDVRLDLHDLTGRRLWQSLLPKREGKVQEKLWLGEVSAGFYLLTVQTNERSWTQKVVLQK